MIEIRHKHINTFSDEIESYDQIYAQKGIRHLDSLYLWILNLLHAHPGQMLLDVSSGEGTLIYLARQRGVRAYGVDISPIALIKGHQDYAIDFDSVANAEGLPFPNCSFDLVTNVGSVEHYFDPAMAIREMSRVLKDDGVACILLPNAYSLFGNVQHVWLTGDVFDDGQPVQRYNTRMGWQHLLTENGLKPFEILKYEREWPLVVQDYFWYAKRPFKLTKLLLSFFVPVNLANSIVYLCSPVSTVNGC